jgi:CheY-like chemotaxis protein
MAKGSELLIVDAVARDREGMRKLFDQLGYVCTAVASGDDAKRFAVQKFFPVALVDLDVDRPDGGLDLARFIREKSTQTSVVLLTGRKSYEGAVEALRSGLTDMVLKVPEQIEHLKQVVALASARSHAVQGSDALFRDVRNVLDESFKVMLSLSRKVYAHLSMAAAPLRPRVLIADGEQDFLRDLAPLIQARNWDIAAEMNGGAALDRGMSQKFDIVAVRNELPDLKGSMVLRSIQNQRGEVLGVLYSSADGGRIDRFEQGHLEDTERPFKGASHLTQRLDSLVEELGTRAQERRFIQAFRSDHEDFMRRYAELKLRIDRLISD